MPLVCKVKPGETVPGKWTSFAVISPKHSWEPPPVAIRIVLQAGTFAAQQGAPSGKVTKTEVFYPARARWSPNLSMSIDLGVYYSSPSSPWPPTPPPPTCEATYELVRSTRP
jgi:hypothetical protein